MRRTVTFLALSALVVGLTLHAAQGEVQTAGLDTLRTDWDQAEPTLSAANVVSSDFGQLFSTRLNGQIYAQPLVIGSTVIASTENDWVYGLDASTGRIKWSRNFGSPWPASQVGCADVAPNIGSTATGVYDALSASAFQ
jgi:outer membrane protein assembly factor BamB